MPAGRWRWQLGGPCGYTRSRLGEWTARLAGLGLKETAGQGVRSLRRAETAIALDAERLFKGLPAESRGALRELPAVVHLVESRVQRLRALVADARANEVANGAHDHLTAGVVALEEIRLQLIRINEGLEWRIV